MLVLVCNNHFTLVDRVRQTVFSLVMEDRRKARVAAPFPNRARTVAWANRARILQGRANDRRRCSWSRKGST